MILYEGILWKKQNGAVSFIYVDRQRLLIQYMYLPPEGVAVLYEHIYGKTKLVPYTCCTKQFEDYYTSQSGKGLPYYQGIWLQIIFCKTFQKCHAFFMRGAKTIGKEALRTGSLIANDVLAGENLKTSVKSRAKEAGKTLAKKAVIKAER